MPTEAGRKKAADAVFVFSLKADAAEWTDEQIVLAIRTLQSVLKERLKTECTGVSARWCPLHGDCTCKDPEDLNDDDCPLHAAHSTHAEGQ